MSYNFIWENWFYSAIFVQYKFCGRHLCVRFHGKIMPDSASTKWHMIIGTSNFFKTDIFVHSYNPTSNPLEDLRAQRNYSWAKKTYLTNQTQLNLTCPELGTAQPQLVYIFLSEIYGASLWRCYMVWSRWQTSIGWLEHERSCGVAVCMTRCQLKSTGVREERKRWWKVVFRSPCMNADATGTRGGPGFRDRTQAEKMPENDFFVGKK